MSGAGPGGAIDFLPLGTEATIDQSFSALDARQVPMKSKKKVDKGGFVIKQIYKSVRWEHWSSEKT